MRAPDFPVVFRAFVDRARGRLRRRWRFLSALLVVFLAALELALHVRFARAAPRLDEWQAVRPAVVDFITPGALVLVAPEWAEPNARFALGDDLMPLEHVARADESSFPNALEISILGQSVPELAGWTLDAQRQQGMFLLRRWTNPAVVPVRYDFLTHVQPPDASAAIERSGASEPCRFSTNNKVSNGDLQGHPTFPRHRYNCAGGGEWSFVGRTVIEDQAYRPRACMWAHPPNRGVLVLRFEAVPIGASIRGHGALPYFLERDSHGAPIELSVSVGGESIGSWQHKDGEGWKGFEFSTARFAGQQLPVEFRVSAKRAANRAFCFQADVR